MVNCLYTERQTISKSLNHFRKNEKLSWHRSDGNPRNFRLFKSIATLPLHYSIQGISQRHLSASGQFDAESLPKIKEIIGNHYEIVIINLRRESCGFIDGKPVSWKDPSYNLGLSDSAIEHNEHQRLEKVKADYNSAMTERELVEHHGLQYHRIPVLDHHRFSDQAVEDVLQLLRKQQPHTWYHVKCHAGKGRTTQFMAMADMFWNAKNLSFDAIIKRQKAIGGANFKRHLAKGVDDPQYEAGKDRLHFLEQFYAFCVEKEPQKDSWSDYVAVKNKEAIL